MWQSAIRPCMIAPRYTAHLARRTRVPRGSARVLGAFVRAPRRWRHAQTPEGGITSARHGAFSDIQQHTDGGIPPMPSFSPSTQTGLADQSPPVDVDLSARAGTPPPQDAPLDAPRNAVGVQLLERALHRQVFPSTSDPVPPVAPLALDISRDHLERHELSASKASTLRPTRFTLPPLQGRDLGEHFWTIGRRAAQPWLDYADEFAAMSIPSPPRDVRADDIGLSAREWLDLDEHLRTQVPLRPTEFSSSPGWTRYPFLRTSDGEIVGLGDAEPVPYPDVTDKALVLDVEVMVDESQFPVMATAVGQNAWYSWLSPWLAQSGERHEEKAHLIPLGPRDGTAPPRLVIGHNVGFDRAAVLDEYSLNPTSIRWLDTMSLHVATSGISSPQRSAWAKHARAKAEAQLAKLLAAERVQGETRQLLEGLLSEDGELDPALLAELDLDGIESWREVLREQLEEQAQTIGASFGSPENEVLSPTASEDHSSVLWQDVTSKNSLADVAALHCGIAMDKEARDAFIDGTPREDIWRDRHSLLQYCANDVSTTHAVYRKVWGAFKRSCPHPATTAGVLGLGSTFLCVNDEWPAYHARANAKFDELNSRVVDTLKHLAQTLMERGVQDVDAWRNAGEPLEPDGKPTGGWWTTDPWYAQLDWSPKRMKRVRGAPPVGDTVPAWFRDRVTNARGPLSTRHKFVPLVLRLRTEDGALITLQDGRWVARSPEGDTPLPGSPISAAFLRKNTLRSDAGKLGDEALSAIVDREPAETVDAALRALAKATSEMDADEACADERLAQLDWTPVVDKNSNEPEPWWPRWYWDLFDSATGELEITIRSKIAPLLLQIAWDGQPIYRSREHGWVYRVDEDQLPPGAEVPALEFSHEGDAHLHGLAEEAEQLGGTLIMQKLPHAKGDGSNVGNPFSKAFLPFFENGRLHSLHPSEAGAKAARDALDMNAQCSYWISARDRIERQQVVWDGQAGTDMGCSGTPTEPRGMILPQVISMGTVTRRAIEKTWLTASNAKKNRIGSELKAMVKAPPGWAIVGADVDSEELWICSVMGDAQFGIHGATAIGWMTLEGSKAQGTDLHSKTASILGTGRNQAKVFNYSRIYGAGIRHATQLLLKANPEMPVAEATQRAKQLYAATKGQNTRNNRLFGHRFWFGGTESFVFNKLEEIATSENPTTPALDCGITAALSKRYLPRNKGAQDDFMPSRINWVVQSSGVDYLHLLITAMDHLCRTYDIQARFMLSVHDEVRYLAKEEDRYRAALALQIANLWTRAMFAFKLNMDDLPEGCAFFAAVDIDHVLRKEVDDPCVTPSQPTPIPPGECLDIGAILERTNQGSLFRDGRPMSSPAETPVWDNIERPVYRPSHQMHRCLGEEGLYFLQAQATQDIDEVRALDRRAKRLAARNSGAPDDPGEAPAGQQRGSRAPRSTGRRPSGRPSSASQAAAARSFSTSCRANGAPSTLEALECMLPPRPVRLRQPFFRRREYRQYVLDLYRRLRRAVRRLPQAALFAQSTYQQFRKYKGVPSRMRAVELCKRAEEVC